MAFRPVTTGDAIMATHVTKSGAKHDGASADAAETATCRTGTCSSGVCSPCVIIWGLVALYLVATALGEFFR